MSISHSHLPNGEHWGLRIDSAHTFHTGSMSAGAKWKLVLHTTEGNGFGAMDAVLTSKDAQPHVLIDPGTRRVKQYIPLNEYARALEHPIGTPDTNRARCVQVEIVGFAAPNKSARDVAEESLQWYANLGALCELLRHRTPFDRRVYHTFELGARRITAAGFAQAEGIIGHMHVPSQPSGHWDPGRLDTDLLIQTMKSAEHRYG